MRKRRAICGAFVVLALLALPILIPQQCLTLLTAIEYRVCHLLPGGNPSASTPLPILMAHRGYVGDDEMMEDSAASVEAAATAGFRAVEVDVNFSADFVPIVFHDPWLSRATGDDGHVAQLSWSQLAELRLRDGQSIMTLADFWQRLAHRFEIVCIDVKSDDQHPVEHARSLSDAMQPHALMPRTMVVGVGFRTLASLRGMRSDLEFGCERFGVIANRLAGFSVVSANPRMRSAGQARLARRLGMTYMVWTLNSESEWRQACGAGVDIVITDSILPRNARASATAAD